MTHPVLDCIMKGSNWAKLAADLFSISSSYCQHEVSHASWLVNKVYNDNTNYYQLLGVISTGLFKTAEYTNFGLLLTLIKTWIGYSYNENIDRIFVTATN